MVMHFSILLMILKRSCRFSIVAALIFSSQLILAQVDLPEEIKSILDAQEFNHAQVSLSVIDIQNGQNLIGYNDQIALIPASSQKVLTTFISISLLGKEFIYDTRVELRGDVLRDGTLDGDIIILGSGDPSLGSFQSDVISMDRIIENIVASIVNSGIKCIDGRIICDASIFEKDAVADSWPWDDICNYYASGAYGFNINDNLYYLDLRRSAKEGSLTTIEDIRPKVPGLKFDNQVTVGAEGTDDNAYFYGDPYSFSRSIKGTIPPGNTIFTIKGAIPNPALLFSQYLRSELIANNIQSEGISVNYIPSEHIHENSRTLFSVKSPHLFELARETNFQSINLYSESFLKTIAAKETKPGSLNVGIEQIIKYINAIGLDEQSIQMKDGSGLSPQNRVTTHLLSEFMAYMYKSLGPELVIGLLPRAGYDGSVRSFLKGSAAMGNVWVKSGSMSGVMSYTGYIYTEKRNWVAISVISNGHTARNSEVRKHFEQLFRYVYLSF